MANQYIWKKKAEKRKSLRKGWANGRAGWPKQKGACGGFRLFGGLLHQRLASAVCGCVFPLSVLSFIFFSSFTPAMETHCGQDQPDRDLCLLLAAHTTAADEMFRERIARNRLCAPCDVAADEDAHTSTDDDDGDDYRDHVDDDDNRDPVPGAPDSVDKDDMDIGCDGVYVSGEEKTTGATSPVQQDTPCQSLTQDAAKVDDAALTEIALIDSIIERCPEGTHQDPSAWAPTISALVDTLPAHGPPLWQDVDDDRAPTYSTGTAAAALKRLLPALQAHGLDVYDVVVKREDIDHVSSPWDAMKPIAEAWCGLGQWLVHVECGRKWFDDVCDGQELAGGHIVLRHLVHRQTRVHVAACRAPLGDGCNTRTQDYFAFMRSGLATPQVFIDAVHGHIWRLPQILCGSFGWKAGPRTKKLYGILGARRRSIDTMRDSCYAFFTRASDGVTVCLGVRDRTILIGRCESGDCGVAPAISLFDPHSAAQPQSSGSDAPCPVKVPRPHADYTSTDPQYKRMRKAARARAHADRTYLVDCGLLDPMHLAVANSVGQEPHWPCVGFVLGERRPADGEAEGDWYRHLAARMNEVADLIRDSASGALGFKIDQEAEAAVTDASPRLQDIVWPLLASKRCLDGEMLDAFADNMLSPIIVSTWRVFRPDTFVQRGSRFIDPARGLYINWRFRCNFVPNNEADGLAHTRFYGHILAVRADQHSGRDREDDCGTTKDPRAPSFVTVAGYYVLSVREPRSTETYTRWCSTERTNQLYDMDDQERTAVNNVLATTNTARETRFGPDEPHHVIHHYREREFAPIPKERFLGILDEDAMRTDGDSESVAARAIRVFDWLQSAFDRHAALFGVRR
nr:hypothetical protein [Pandoravirus massiliensis]